MITEFERNNAINDFSKILSKDSLILIEHKVDNLSKQTDCISNVLSFKEKNGGEIVYGWTFHHRFSQEFGDYLFATHHAIWKNSRGVLIDITPFHEKVKHHPINISEKILFLQDFKAQPYQVENYLIPLPLKYFAIKKTKELKRYIDYLKKKEMKHYFDNYGISEND